MNRQFSKWSRMLPVLSILVGLALPLTPPAFAKTPKKAAVKTTQKKSPETKPAETLPTEVKIDPNAAPEATQGSIPDKLVPILSPSMEHYLRAELPVIKTTFLPLSLDYDWKAIGIEPLPNWSLKLTGKEVMDYQRLSEDLKVPEEEKTHAAAEKSYLRADILLLLGLIKDRQFLHEAQEAYLKTLTLFPDSRHVLKASYHLSVILLELEKFDDGLYLTSRQSLIVKEDSRWSTLFRSLIMESYYRRLRFAKAEVYMWGEAGIMGKAQLTSYLALRYGDSLFWQGKYKEATEWYAKVPNFVNTPDSPANELSRLYFAEALYQLKDFNRAKENFEGFQRNYTGQKFIPLAELRLYQIALVKGASINTVIANLKKTAFREMDNNVGKMSQVIWARLAARTNNIELQKEAIQFIQKMLQDRVDKNVEAEAIYSLAINQWSAGDHMQGMQTLARLGSRLDIQSQENMVSELTAELAVYFIATDAPDLLRMKRANDLLVLSDMLAPLVQIASNKEECLIPIGRAYIETGMTAAGAKIYQKILFQAQLSPEKKRLAALELARTYGLMGDVDLMEKALKLIDSEPTEQKEKELYHLVMASYNLATKKYSECSQEFDTLLQNKITGNQFFQYALQGAICARKAKKIAEAEKFITLLGNIDAIISERTIISKDIWRVQQQGLFERINLLVLKGSTQEAVDLFSRLQKEVPEAKPPAEVLFSVVDAYRQLGRTDEATKLWEKEGKLAGDLPDKFSERYLELLETLNQYELIGQ